MNNKCKESEYTRPPFDNRLSDITGVINDEKFANALIKIFSRHHREIIRFTDKSSDDLFNQVKQVSGNNYAAKELNMPERVISVNNLRKAADSRLSKRISTSKRDAFIAIDEVVRKRTGAIDGVKLAHQHHYSSAKDREDTLVNNVKSNANITIDELESCWNSKYWVSYYFLNVLRETANRRNLNWNPRHFLDDTSELTIAVGMYAKDLLNEINANSDIEPALEAVKTAATTGYDSQGKLLLNFDSNGKLIPFDYKRG